MASKEEEPKRGIATVTPSLLPRLEECRCFIHDGIPNEAMRRGTALDACIRHLLQPRGLQEGDNKWLAEHPEDIVPVLWGVEKIKEICGDGIIVTDERSLRPASFCPDYVRSGIMDGACYEKRITIELKTGEETEYSAQPACYAANCLKRLRDKENSTETDDSVWTTYLLFVDAEKVVRHTWTWPQATKKVTDIIHLPMVPHANKHCTWCGHWVVCAERMKNYKEGMQ